MPKRTSEQRVVDEPEVGGASAETVGPEKETAVAEKDFVPKKKSLWEKIKSFEEKGGEDWEEKRKEFLLKLQGRKVYHFVEGKEGEEYLTLKGGVDIEANGDAIFVLYDEDGNEKGEKTYNLNKVGYREYKSGAPKDPKEKVVVRDRKGEFNERTTEGMDPKKFVKYSSGGKTAYAEAVKGRPDPSKKTKAALRGPEVELDAPEVNESLVDTKEFIAPENLTAEADEASLLEAAQAEIAAEEQRIKEVEILKSQVISESAEVEGVEVAQAPIEVSIPETDVKKSSGGFRGWMARRWQGFKNMFGTKDSDVIPELPIPEPKKYNLKNRYNDLSNKDQEEVAAFERGKVKETERLQQETVGLVKEKEEKTIAQEFGKREAEQTGVEEDFIESGEKSFQDSKGLKTQKAARGLVKHANRLERQPVFEDGKEFGEGVEETEEEKAVRLKGEVERKRILESDDLYEVFGLREDAKWIDVVREYTFLEEKYAKKNDAVILETLRASKDLLKEKIDRERTEKKIADEVKGIREDNLKAAEARKGKPRTEKTEQLKDGDPRKTRIPTKEEAKMIKEMMEKVEASAADTVTDIVVEEPKVEKEPEYEYEGPDGAEITKDASLKIKAVRDRIMPEIAAKLKRDDIPSLMKRIEGGFDIDEYAEKMRWEKSPNVFTKEFIQGLKDAAVEIEAIREEATAKIRARKKKKI